jgi:pilus assembly protein CpaB
VSLRTLLIVLLALMCGGSAALGINLFLRSGPVIAEPETIAVVVAAVEIPRGASLTAELLTIRAWPKALAPTGALTQVADALDRVAIGPLAQGEPILDAKLTTRGAGRGLSALIPHGMRAFTIQTPGVAAGVAGFILPGNRVDVLLTVSTPNLNDPTGGGSTTTLLQNVEILAVDQRMAAPADNKVDLKELRSVTLLVTPDQATKLDLGQNKGTLHLTLRNPEDSLPAHTRPATLAGLRFHQERPWDERARGVLDALGNLLAQPAPAMPASEPAPKVERPKAHVMTIFNGDKISRYGFRPQPESSNEVAGRK